MSPEGDIHKGDPAHHPYLIKGLGHQEVTIVDHGQLRSSNMRPKPMPPFTVIDQFGNRPSFLFDISTIPDHVKAAAWDSVNRSMPDASSGEKTYEAMSLMKELSARERQAQQQVSGGYSPYAQSGPAYQPPPQFQPSLLPFANPGFPQGQVSGLYPPPSPQFQPPLPPPTPQAPPVVAPPSVRVDFYLSGFSAPMQFYYHSVQIDGAWLRLIFDERYPGSSRFPVDNLESEITVAIAGHANAYACHPTGNFFRFGDHSISSLIIDHEIPQGA